MKNRTSWSIFIAVAILVVGGIAAFDWFRRSPTGKIPPIQAGEQPRITSNVLYTVSAETVAEVLRIEAQEKEVAETLWARELLAQACGRTIERLWDALNAATNAARRWEVAASLPVGQIVLPKWEAFHELPRGIRFATSRDGRSLDGAAWPEMLARFQKEGWRLEQVEFRHNRFEVDAAGNPLRSRFYFSAHLMIPDGRGAGASGNWQTGGLPHMEQDSKRRVQVEGDLVIDWGAEREGGGASVKKVDASGLTIKIRHGPPAFKLVLDDEITPQGQSRIFDPLILYDLEGDGLSEIILAGRNLVYRNRGNFRFDSQPLCQFPEEFISTALIADFDGDGLADFLCNKWEGLFLFKGSREGQFNQKPRLAWKPEKPLANPKAMTCGDIDADGDLDLFIGQYKEPYEGGATPKPFFDANDGFPAFLLVNHGTGTFEDETETRGLAPKRSRRTYSASFADLDHDRDLDLLVVSDFAGLDLYQNDGQGQFTAVTRQWVENSRAFGMAHALSDFNNDARIDLLMIGMTSPAAERLNHLGLWRDEVTTVRPMRGHMTYGNRLYLGASDRGFLEQTPLSSSIARSGWSWGCAASDFDNDGWVDAYIGNGLESNSSVTDYESEYWLHDKYVGLTNASSATDLYFRAKFSRTRGRSHSYGGHERNRLYFNLEGKRFFEAGYLCGVALPEDTRNVVSDDLDADGRIDLALTTYEIWPRSKQTLRIFRNDAENSPNWIGFRFENDPEPNAWVGAEIKLVQPGGTTVRHIVTGDSYRSQHAPVAHFGLGKNSRIDRIEIRRIGQEPQEIRPEEINRYHDLPR